MSKCSKCGDPIEESRLAWNAPTCSSCSAEGCGVPWIHGAPIRRCDSCDCMPPIEHAFGDVLEELKRSMTPAEFRRQYEQQWPIEDPPAMFHMEQPAPRIRGTLRIKL